MKFFILLTLCLLHPELKAQQQKPSIPKDKVIYHFSELDKNISADQFRRYVIPQLKSMANEYYLLIKKIEPLSSEIIDIKRTYSSLSDQWTVWKSRCLGGGDNCNNLLHQVYKEFKGIEKHISAFSGVLPQLDTKRPAMVDTVLSMHSEFNELVLLDTKILRALEEMLITMDTPYWTPGPLANEIDLALHRANLISSMNFTRMIPKEIADDFEFVWNSFINPIEKRVIQTNDDTFLMKRLETFNNNWNAFHMKIAKSNKDVDRGLIQIVETMHTRWNNVLKVIMKLWN